MVVNFQMNFVQDWKTGYKESIAGFVADYTKCSFKDAMDFVGHIDVPMMTTKVIDMQERTSHAIKFPEGTKSLEHESWFGNIARRYLNERFERHGLDWQYFNQRGWSFCEDGYWQGRLIIPYKIKGKLVTYTGRSIVNHDTKYLFPRNEDVLVGKSDVVYNQDALFKYNSGYIVEGAIDAETIGDNAIAIGGWKPSVAQIDLIRKSRWKTVRLVPDRGFEYRTTAFGYRLTDVMDVFIDAVPEPHKDVNDCGFDLIIKSNKKL